MTCRTFVASSLRLYGFFDELELSAVCVRRGMLSAVDFKRQQSLKEEHF